MADADYEQIRNRWPQLAHLIDDPEVGQILRAANANPIEWPDEKFMAALMATPYFRSRSADARNIEAVLSVDPATYQRRFDQTFYNVRRLAGQLGIGLSSDRMWHIATKALAEGLTDDEIRYLMVEDEWHLTPGDTEAQVRRAYADYFIPMSDEALKEATAQIVRGFQTIEGLRAMLAEQTVQLYPHMAYAVESGMTPRQWFAPYQQQIAQILEINPNTVDPTRDDRWRPIFEVVDEKGNHRAMTLYESAQYLRSMPEFRRTRQGRDTAAEFGEAFLREMGKVAA